MVQRRAPELNFTNSHPTGGTRTPKPSGTLAEAGYDTISGLRGGAYTPRYPNLPVFTAKWRSRGLKRRPLLQSRTAAALPTCGVLDASPPFGAFHPLNQRMGWIKRSEAFSFAAMFSLV
jgi:hypothetical protein